MQLDELDRKATAAFEGYVVRKDLVRTFRPSVPGAYLRCRVPAGAVLRDHGRS